MHKIKIFSHTDNYKLNKEIDDFINKYVDKIISTSLTTCVPNPNYKSDITYTVLIHYLPKPQ